MRESTQFCGECGREMPYRIKRRPVSRRIHKKECVFEIAEAVCTQCGKEIHVPGLIDYNAAEIDRQYREQERLISVQRIKSLMKNHQIEKEALSLALGLDEIKIDRYLAGQVPSREDSDMIRKALEPLSSLSEKMQLVISYLLKKTKKVTPLALQKMLYFMQGIHMALFGRELFPEDCQAWAHGPVFKEVYEVFRDFQYHSIEDTRFSMLRNRLQELSDHEKKVIDLVIESLGLYNGKTLELITHGEAPWKEAREDCEASQRSNKVIAKESMRKYFQEAAGRYDFTSAAGILEYTESRLHMDSANCNNIEQ